MLSLRRLLCGKPAASSVPPVLYTTENVQQTFTGHFGAVKLRRMLILNCERVSVFHDISLLLANQPFEITHYMYASQDVTHTVRALHAALPILYSPNYSGFSYLLPSDPDHVVRGLMTSDLIACEYTGADFALHQELIVFDSSYSGRSCMLNGGLDALYALLPSKESMQPVHVPAPGDDLLAYNGFCAELEKNHAVYRIKPDLGLEQIPVNLLEPAVRDAAPAEVLAFLGPLTDMFAKRQQNVLTKSQPQYHVMKKNALARFVQTGRTSDHLWCCRSFTMEERAQILIYLRDQLLALPNFHLYLLRDDDALRDDEVILYDGIGLSLIKPGTDYGLEQSHTEILITQKEFLNVYKRFFTESILGYRVETEAVTRIFLDKLISRCLTGE